MLPEPVRDEILEALPERYWVEVTHPSDLISEIALDPQLRKHREEFDEPDPPYESVALAWTETGVVEQQNPIDQHVGTEWFTTLYVPLGETYTIPEGKTEKHESVDVDGTLEVEGTLLITEIEEGHAHGQEIKGRNAYDTLELIVTAEGTVMVDGEPVGPQDRALNLCDAVHSFLTKHWKTRPLDLFDDDGAPINSDNLAVPDAFADELTVPVLPRVIPGRGATDMSDMVEDSEAQVNAAVELAYVDTWSEHYYLAEEVPIETTAEVEAYDTR